MKSIFHNNANGDGGDGGDGGTCPLLRNSTEIRQKSPLGGTEVPVPSVPKKLSVMHSISVCLITEKYVMMQRIISR